MRSGAASEQPTLVRLMAEIGGGSSAGTGINWPTANSAGGTGYMSGSNRDTWRPTLEGAAIGHRPVLHQGRPQGGQWATPNVPNGGRAMSAEDVASKGSTPRGKRQVDLGSQAALWPTTTKQDAASSGRHSTQTGVMHPGTTLTDAARQWPTPNAMALNNGELPETWRARQAKLLEKGYNGNGAGVPLAIAAQESMALWPTARGEDAESAGNHPGATDSLTGATKRWATPNAKTANDSQTHRSGDRSDELLLTGQAKAWATPRQSDWRSGEVSDAVYEKNARPLTEQANRFPSGLQDQMIGPGGKPFSLGGRTLRPQLSALFVEWLMLGPDGLGWTCVCAPGPIAFADSETLSSLPRPKRRSGFSGSEPSA